MKVPSTLKKSQLHNLIQMLPNDEEFVVQYGYVVNSLYMD